MSNSRGRGPTSKAKAKAKYTKLLTVTGLVLAGFLLLVVPSVQGQNNILNRKQIETEELQLSYVNRVSSYKKKANYWYKKRTGKSFVAALRPTNRFDTLEGAERAVAFWSRESRKQKTLYIRYANEKKKKINSCVRAGWPRKLCPDVVSGTASAGVPDWHDDPALAWIVKHESGFRPCVKYGGHIDCNYSGGSSYGLFQFIGSTWSGVGCRITSNAAVQVKCGSLYIKRRYRTPAAAKNWWLAHNWY